MRISNVTTLLSRASGPALVMIGLAIGVLLSACWGSVLRKSTLMEGTSTIERFRRLAAVTSEIGLTHFRPCGGKVEELHSLLSNRASGSATSDRSVQLVASILLDGQNCNQHILKHIESRNTLPELPFYRDFRLVSSGNHELSQSLQDEQGLFLWMLTRINPDRLLPSPEFTSAEAFSDEEFRNHLTEEWKHILK